MKFPLESNLLINWKEQLLRMKAAPPLLRGAFIEKAVIQVVQGPFIRGLGEGEILVLPYLAPVARISVVGNLDPGYERSIDRRAK